MPKATGEFISFPSAAMTSSRTAWGATGIRTWRRTSRWPPCSRRPSKRKSVGSRSALNRGLVGEVLDLLQGHGGKVDPVGGQLHRAPLGCGRLGHGDEGRARLGLVQLLAELLVLGLQAVDLD